MKLTLGDIADKLNLELRGDATVEITGIANLADAAPGQLTFLFNSAYKKYLAGSSAAAVVLNARDADDCRLPMIISDRPRMTWAKVAALFDPTPAPDRVIHPAAQIADTASIAGNVSIGACAVVESNAEIREGAIVGPGCYVGHGSTVGEGSRLYANVTLYHDVIVGRDCIIHAGAVLGADGFGLEFDRETGSMVKIPQVYGVRIGNNVEIGAGTTIDRGALNHTSVDDGAKLDNQIQVGHGTRIGSHTVISGCTAIAGSTKIGSYCLIGGAVGIVDNIEIADQVEITAMTMVIHSITEKGRYSSGTGMWPSRIWKRSVAGFGKLDELIKRVRALENRRDQR